MKQITTETLRRMADSEGLILQGCGGDPQEWLDGVNEMFTQESILLDGDTFKEVSSFEHGGVTNLLFCMDTVKLDVGKLALWRLESHYQEMELTTMITIRIQANHLADDDSYKGAILTLPANKAEILDSLDAARLPYGSGEYRLTNERRTPGFLKTVLENCAPSIAEMNHLAERLESLSSEDFSKVEGILEIRKAYDIADAINATHNLYRFVQHPVYDDQELGEVAIENSMYESLEQVPDELLDSLDRAKVGALVREQDGGVFTNDGYVIQESEGWETVYDGELADRAVTLEAGDPIVSLLLGRDKYTHSGHDSGWLHCPASEPEITAILDRLKMDDLEGCTVHEIRCVIPTLADSVFHGASNHEINTLAGAIQTNCLADLVKYKAVCEMENVVDIDAAMSLTTRLHEYDFEPYPSTTAFGKMAMAKTGADMKLLEEYGFDFDVYGHTVMEEQGVRFLSYGFVSHPRGPEQTMGMTVPEPMLEPGTPLEPTMGM